ncbi:twin-arginine translocation signal domain-containing protein [Sphaerisporangium sp. NPDC049002]|uniref:twin-arginine translocation signal domain-containing protein n=1 Tax=unclassified Sphaerisporangium TaxID=2630420 RepID=UPI0033CC12AD
MRQQALTRRAVLRGTAAGAVAVAVAGCSARETPPPAPKPPDPETVLLTGVIADKERMVALYRQAVLSGGKMAAVLGPFQQRHEVHLAELRRRLPPSPAPASPTPSAAAGSPPAAARVSVGRLRELERKAAAARPRQIANVSPALAQLLACIGACEAAHAVALARAT